MKKRVISFLILFSMLISMIPSNVFANNIETDGTEANTNNVENNEVKEQAVQLDWEYEAYGDGIALTKYLGLSTDIYVPNKLTVDGTEYPVIKLADSIFENNDAVNSVTLASGILEIGAKAFYDCDNLVCILVSEELQSIGEEAFFGCDIFNSIILYDGLLNIDKNAFASCPKLTIWCNAGTCGFMYAVNNDISYSLLNPNASIEIFDYDGVTYYVQNGEAVAIGVLDTTITEATIPSTVYGYPVTELSGTFNNCNKLVSVTLPESIKSFGTDTFRLCYVLSNINIPSNLQSIGRASFYCCYAIDNVILPDSVTRIDDWAFFYCRSLEYIELSKNLSYIGEYSFEGCSIKGLTIPNNVETISKHAFFGCRKLVRVQLPNSVTSLKYRAFSECVSLETINIPNSVLDIGNEAFYNCKKLSSVIIPEGVLSIGEQAFDGCTSLNMIMIPKSVNNMYENSFSATTALVVEKDSYAYEFAVKNDILVFINNGNDTPIMFEENGIQYYACNGEATALSVSDKKITEAIIPSTVRGYRVTALYETFQNCSSLTKVVLPNTIKTIGKRNFSQCSNLTSITLPDSLEVLGDWVFFNCYSLTEISIPNNVTTIGEHTFQYCDGLEKVIIPNNVEVLGQYAFFGCGSLQSISVSDNVKVIGESTFAGCGELTYVSLGNGVEIIKSKAFEDCRSIKDITIPDSVTTINTEAFSHCEMLESVVIPDSVVDLYESSFDSTTLWVVNKGSYAYEYAIRNDLSYVINGEPIEIFEVGGVRYRIQNKEAIAIGVVDQFISHAYIKEEIYGYPVTQLKGTFADCRQLLDVTLPYTITNISKNAFSGCSMLQRIYIPDGVVSIGEEAFAQCHNLKEVSIPYSVKSIGVKAFEGCSRLTNIVIPEGVISIGESAFSGCDNLSDVIICDGVEIIGESAFFGCSSIVNLKLPDSVKVIGSNAFCSCSNLKYVQISSNVSVIPNLAFAFCYSLDNVIIPEGVICIDDDAFSVCRSLTSIILPSSIKRIGARTFQNCESLVEIILPNNLEEIDNYAFSSCPNLKSVVIPSSVIKMYETSFTANTIHMVQKDTYAYDLVTSNNLLYFILRNSENPEISYGASIEGTVVNNTGASESKVTVEIYYEDGTLKESVTTDENGKYVFTYAEVGKYVIKAYNALGNTATTTVSVKRMNVFDVFISGDTNITLKTSYTVSGTVTDVATIKLLDLNGNVINSITNASSFTFTNVANGTYIVVAENENGAVTKEFTLYNGNVSGLYMKISSQTAAVWGYVEVEERDGTTVRRNWVDVSVYNSDGSIIATQKTDSSGKYTFEKLEMGSYSIIAKVTEIRPDKYTGNDRSYELTAGVSVTVNENGEYQLDTILLKEPDEKYYTDVSGKVNLGKDQSDYCDIMMYNSSNVEFARVHSENGKYTFKNVPDGAYFIIAVTENYGAGSTAITITNGKVSGNTNVNLIKSDKISKREKDFEKDVPELESKEEAEEYRLRIAEEKRFYDSLSKKEQNQLSKEYVERLNKYVEWLTNCENNAGVENGGLVISGDEIENGDNISFTITVEKQEKWEENENGVQSSKDFIHHNMKDKAGKGEIVEYYEISMTKTSNGNDRVITSVYKDTDAMGKFRITLEIPEEYRGQKHYSLVHEHCGEVTVLTDLDDNPNTITVEIDKFSTFALATTNEELIDESVSTVTLDDIIRFKGYSVGPDGKSMCAGYDVDYAALDAYERKTGNTVDFGVVFASYERLNGKTPFDPVTGKETELEKGKVIKYSLTEHTQSVYDCVMTDIDNAISDHSFVIAGYIYDGESVYYIQENGFSSSVTGITLNQILAFTK